MKINTAFIWTVCLLTFLLRMLFTLFYAEPGELDPAKMWFDPFPFGGIEEFGFWNYVYHGAERISWLLFTSVTFLLTKDRVLGLFACVKFVDAADYFLTGNTAYFFTEQGIPVSYNILSFIFWIAFGILMLTKWTRSQLVK